ncbi:uncharacterized protein LOC143030923 isoform X2 [Oratosquilla oratoria]|uniref:uncharacterized protein LOC143030923 isoform X2 n=1 Tax=Oratosquilla oratoria TaxID=337810 RepID=UPI003F76E15F
MLSFVTWKWRPYLLPQGLQWLSVPLFSTLMRWVTDYMMTSEAAPPDAETQLRDLFNSCVTVVRPITSLSEAAPTPATVTTPLQPVKGGVVGSVCGTLTDAGLVQLCGKLQLDCAVGQLKCILQRNRKDPENAEGLVDGVTFKEFLDAFVSLLSQQEQRSKSPQGGFSSPIVESMSGRTVNRDLETSPQGGDVKNKSRSSLSSVRMNLVQVLEEQEGEEMPVQGISSSNQPPSLGLVGDSEEDYLRNTWRRLGVGHDGFLSLEELASVCHAIGMEKVAHEVIEQLFSRLDVDGDGRISFEEFLHMFQNGGPTPNSSLTLTDSKQQEMRTGSHSRVSTVGQDRLGTSSESGIFSSIDQEGSGYVNVESLLELWDSLHIGEGTTCLLQHLGFSQRPQDRVCLSDLTSALEDECGLTEQDPNRRATPHNVALISFSSELKFVRGMLESTRCERDKLRSDLNEANQRLGLLAQELDEHNAHMEADTQLKIQELERQHKEQIRLLQEAVGQERDSVREQVAILTRDLQKHNAQLQEEDTKLRNQVALLQKDIKRLEGENLDLCSRVGEGDRALLMLEKQGAELYHLKHKVAEFESSSPREEEYRTLLERLDRISTENQRLRDCNDEYLAQIEAQKMRHLTSSHSDRDCPNLDGSCMGDYLDSSLSVLAPGKRRGSNSCGSGEDSCGEESPRGGKVRRCSKGLNFHYVDVRSCDESFLDTSLSPKGQSAIPSHHSSFNEGSQPPSLEDGASLKVPHTHSSTITSKVFSHVPNSVDKDLSGKRCGSCTHSQSSQDHDESEEQQALDKEVAELCRQPNKQQQIDKVRVEVLEHQCQGLEGELGRLKVEVVKVVEEKERLEEERDRLQEKCKEISFKASDAVKMRTLQKRCRALAEKIQSKRLALMGRDDKVENNGATSGKEKRSLETVPEEEEELDDPKEPKADSGNEEESKEDDYGLLEEQVLGLQEDLCQERDFLEKQKAQLEDKLRTLEHSYEMLQLEFDKTEDYWSLKLQEEQEYYEEERKLYDEKFHALERKVHEYDERFAASGGDLDDSNPCKLSTIEESVMWEKQVTDLEDEVTQLRKQVGTLQQEHYNMDELVEERVQEAREAAGQELQQQISSLQSQLVQQQTLNNQLKEQMSKLHQEYEHHVKELQRKEHLDQPTDGCQANDMNQECTSTTEAHSHQGPSTIGYCGGEETIVTLLRTQLREAQSRLRNQEAALKHHHTHANHILKVSREQHAAEVANLEAMMGATQRMLGQHIAKYKDQLSKASRSDALVRELYLENAQLMRALQVTEGRQKSAEESGRRLGLQQLAHTCT